FAPFIQVAFAKLTHEGNVLRWAAEWYKLLFTGIQCAHPGKGKRNQERVDKHAPDDYIPSQCIVSPGRSVSQPGKSIRLRRILHSERGSLVVAFDHPLVHGPIPGTIEPAAQISRFVDVTAAALALKLGMLC